MTKPISIDSLYIKEPCSEPWENMNGTDSKRFCGSCRKDVFNLTAMNRRQANRLIRKSGGRICVRYAKLSNGRILTTDKPLYQISRKTAGIAAGVLATTISLSALTFAQGGIYFSELLQVAKPEVTASAPLAPLDPPGPDEKTSQISIVVLDSTGVVIPGATVIIRDEKGQKGVKSYTSSDGSAFFSMLRKSRYTVEAFAEGFGKQTRKIILSLDIEPGFEVTLDAGIYTGMVDGENNEIPVFDLIAKNDIKGVSAAIAAGFNIKTKDSNKKTALHVAVYHLRVELVKMLVANGADVNAKDKYDETPIVILAQDVGEDDEDVNEILRFLISKGVDIDVANGIGETILMEAAYYDDPIVVEMLLAAGAKTEIKDEDGITAYKKIEDERIREIFHRYGVFQ